MGNWVLFLIAAGVSISNRELKDQEPSEEFLYRLGQIVEVLAVLALARKV
jgi:hypothetical protein